MSVGRASTIANPFLILPLGRLFLSNAFPMAVVKPWLATPALIVFLDATLGLRGLWLAFPVADAVLILLALGMCLRAAARPPRATAALAKEVA